jgi:AraC family transcriptional regulator
VLKLGRPSSTNQSERNQSIPKQQYAVFRHHGHVSELPEMLDAIWSSWLPASGYRAGRIPGAPDFFERYGEKFDPVAGRDDIEIWVPIAN